jgi:MFS family permease
MADFLLSVVVVSALGPVFLSPPPYLLSPSGIGLYTLASFVGIIVAYPVAGPATDFLSRLMARRNGGVHEPKHRMPALVLPFVICPPGLILLGYTIAHGQSLYVSAVGYAMQSAALVFVPSVTMSYVVDTYPATGGEALVLINAGKNLVAFGVTLSCSAWLHKEGIMKLFCELAGAQWAVLLMAVPLYIFDAWLRRKTMIMVH